MAEHSLRFKSKISRRSAHEMILLFAKHGNHIHNTGFKSDADVKRGFVNHGIDFEELVMRCREYHQDVPFFENLIGCTAVAVGTTLARVDNRTGETDLSVEAPGALILHGYWATFETAVEALKRAVEKASYAEFQSAVVQGISSIEGYVNYRAEFWNKQHPDTQLSDSRQSKVPFDEKIDVWIPVMANDKKLTKGGVEWRNFRILRAVRDNEAVHPKMSGYSFSYSELAEKINLFRTGIAHTLIQLHLLFNERIPRVIIRSAYAPDVEVVENTLSLN